MGSIAFTSVCVLKRKSFPPFPKPEIIPRKGYYLSPRETMTVHAGAVYALYLLYFTQPTSFPKVPIRLTIHAWHVLESIYKQAFVHKATDPIYVIRKLRDSNAFVYVAQETPVSKPVMGNNEFVASEVEKKLIQTERAMHDEVLVRLSDYHVLIAPLLPGHDSYPQPSIYAFIFYLRIKVFANYSTVPADCILLHVHSGCALLIGAN
ncbi:hypothetical protein K457DRAFT_178603 [Linnemannia elongata AG-77]|uniref:Uncharacterized protein n=1 Tax=Linnemannia elongata AG-77 TaxID=1314771 RepID=A0A197KKH1_9FUNG|nr:hypothetical protein K457DRAFT_178603 [Linnemannia elongata AG-77]